MRTNSIVIVCGKRGTGKTDYCKSLLKVSSLEKKLVVDTFDSPTWRNLKTFKHPEWEQIEIPIMEMEQLKLWKKGLYRVFSSDPDELFVSIDKYVTNAIIEFEDATKYFKGKLQESVRRLMYDSKQKNLDLIFVFHSLSAVPPELVRIADYLTLFKTNDGSPNMNKYPFPSIIPAMKFVRESKSRYENVTIELS